MEKKMAKVHWIGSQVFGGWQYTACGLEGMRAKNFDNEFETVEGHRFEANFRNWQGVTCGRCLKSPHAPGGRIAVARATKPTR